MTKFDIANYVASNIQDPLSRMPGVGSMNLFGTQYAMRIWLDPVKLTSFALTPLDVTDAIRAQNAQVSSGTIGDLPNAPGQSIFATVVVNGQLSSIERGAHLPSLESLVAIAVALDRKPSLWLDSAGL